MRLTPSGGLWGHADFLRLWGAQTISQFGSQITLLALPLAAIVTLDASAFEASVLGALEYAPFLLLTLPAGVWVDRLRRRPLLVAADLARAIVLASVPLAWALDALTLWQLYFVGFVTGTLTVVFDVAYVPYVAVLVPREQLVDANSKVEISRSAAQTAGPGIAGALVQLVTAPYALAVDAISFLLSGLLVTRIRAEEVLEPTSEAPSGRRELAEGLRYVLGHPILRPIMACTALSNFFGTAIWGPILLVYAVRELELSAGTIGVAFTLGNLGVLAGAFLVTRITRRFGLGPTIAGSALLFGPPVLLVPLAPQESAVPWIVAAFAITGFGGVVYNVSIRSLLQAVTPNRLLGRATAVGRTIVWGVIPLGTLAGGALASTVGVHEAIWIGAAGAACAALPILLSRVPRLVDVPAQA
jgi:MFS family permease